MATTETDQTNDVGETCDARILVLVPRSIRAKVFQMANKNGTTLSGMARKLLMKAVEQETRP